MAAAKSAEIKKQVEYYLSDKNLAMDKFFNQKLQEAGAEGWLDLANILACNKIKTMKITAADIVSAVKDSTEIEVDDSGKKVRRIGAKALPKLSEAAPGTKKRDVKAADKAEDSKNEETKGEAAEEALPQLDERGNPVFSNADFENPVIIHFKTESPSDPAFKVNWKDIEAAVRKEYPRLKIVYSRADPHEGDLALSSHKINSAELEKLSKATIKIQEHDFTFSKTIGEDLKSFWQKQGGHYQFCIQPKLRNIKKQQRNARQKRERDGGDDEAGGNKRGKISYEIAGVYYQDINKVKSKARAILNLKKDGEKLSGNDADFIKELLAFHEKGTEKLRDFAHFEVGEHPDYAKTRCFFVGRSDGAKEDFSISKCITKLEQQS